MVSRRARVKQSETPVVPVAPPEIATKGSLDILMKFQDQLGCV